MDYLRYYDLEGYIFEDVHKRFHSQGYIGAFDLLSIVIWKANRAKTYAARGLLKKSPSSDLESAARELTGALHGASSSKERLRLMMKDWGFQLPTATGILSVFWPDEFTVYDVRVCGELGAFHKLGNWSNFEKVWQGYSDYVGKVGESVPGELSLRDKDRYLWGRSAAKQLERDIARRFQ